MSVALARIAARLFDTPLLVRPETAIAIASNLAERFGVDAMAEAEDAAVIEASRFRGRPAPPVGGADGRDGRSMYRVDNGVALVGVHGELVNRGAWIGSSSGLTSYEGLEAQLRAADADASVSGILLDMNSPGGEASGAMETAALVRSINARKPIVAFVNGMAASAGYAIASGAGAIVTTQSAILGSIGVVMVHVDRSASLARAGVKPTLIYAGAHKVDGSSLAALPDDARERIQGSIDQVYELFVKTVASHRGLTPKAVRATEGGIRMGQAAVDAGLADAVGTYDDALAMLAVRKKPSSNGAFPIMDTITKAEHESALKAAGVTAGLQLSAAVSAAVGAERARVKTILGHAEAKGRDDFAAHLAFDTDLTAEAAAAMLGKAPKATAPVVSTADAVRKPRLAVVDPQIEADAPERRVDANADWGAIVADLNAGAGFKPAR